MTNTITARINPHKTMVERRFRRCQESVSWVRVYHSRKWTSTYRAILIMLDTKKSFITIIANVDQFHNEVFYTKTSIFLINIARLEFYVYAFLYFYCIFSSKCNFCYYMQWERMGQRLTLQAKSSWQEDLSAFINHMCVCIICYENEYVYIHFHSITYSNYKTNTFHQLKIWWDNDNWDIMPPVVMRSKQTSVYPKTCL